ncbi:MAG: MarR family winged helix-turn-helix transcriptional regulator [Acidimicrobiales bacterium]
MDSSAHEGTSPHDGIENAGRANSVGFTLSQVGLETARQFGDVVGALGLEPRHFALLNALQSTDGQSQQVIGDHLGIPASTMVSIVDHLEEAGLLERRLHSSDRRTRTLHLTSRGDTLRREAFAAAMGQEARICAGFEPGERTQLLALLRRVSSNLGVSSSMLPDRGSGERPQRI